MAKITIINGSPRAATSNSKEFGNIFVQYWKGEASVYSVSRRNNQEICSKLDGGGHLLFVFPLYADSLPVTLLYFLNELAQHPVSEKPTVHVIINCGFMEPEQNNVAVEIIRLFCSQNGYAYGSTLCIGAGEAILGTPFRLLVKRKLKALAWAIQDNRQVNLKVTMPISKKMFVRASTRYWISYGEKYHVDRLQMDTIGIEGPSPDI